MLTLLRKLYRTRLLAPAGLYHLLMAVLTTGTNLMALLHVAACLHPQRLAVSDGRERLSYRQLTQQTEALAIALQTDYGVQRGQKVAIACRNHAAAIEAIFAVSRLGAHVFLFNPELSAEQMQALIQRLRIDFFIYDGSSATQLPDWLERATGQRQALPAYHATAPSVDRLASPPRTIVRRLKPVRGGNIVVMTGGTTGQPKPASRKPSLLNFLPPFVALLSQVHLERYRSLYIATPIYHGFGLAALLMGVVLGAELYVMPRFEAGRACALVVKHRIEVVTLVPLMLQRMLEQAPGSLSALQCILSGGAILNPTLAQAALTRFGPIVFNLYGTSEAGFCILGTPDKLQRKPASIGQPIRGVRARIVDAAAQPVSQGTIGNLQIRSAWSTQQQSWLATGDLAYRDPDGDLFLCGRADDAIVSGGENVYPVELENVLRQHPDLEAVAVVGIPDAEFGQRLKAIAVKTPKALLTPTALRDWLKPRVARYQMPVEIEFRATLPHTPLGKLDRKLL